MTNKQIIAKAMSLLGKSTSEKKRIAAQKNGFLCKKDRTQAEIAAHNAEVMRQAIGRSTTGRIHVSVKVVEELHKERIHAR